MQRIREAEDAAADLVAKGWSVERIVHVDEAEQPFRTIIRLRCDGESEGPAAL